MLNVWAVLSKYLDVLIGRPHLLSLMNYGFQLRDRAKVISESINYILLLIDQDRLIPIYFELYRFPLSAIILVLSHIGLLVLCSIWPTSGRFVM